VHVHAAPNHQGRLCLIAMAGTKQKALDHKGRYRKQCDALADALGWQPSAMFSWWREFVAMREFEQRWPRAVAEWMALRDLHAFFDKRGCQESD
jgi:hypothetical protein